jgi:hypothetical protein
MFFGWFRKKTTNCPNCKIKWDGIKCIRCGYLIKLRKKPELLTPIMDLFDPKDQSPQELYCEKELIPESTGVYAWYFDNNFGSYFTHKSQSDIKFQLNSANVQNWYLLYVGVAGKKEGRTLRDRIYSEHLNQNSKGSTLRQTLASLLWKDIHLIPAMQLNGENEKQKLNNWMFQHARVSWTETTKPELIEELILKYFGCYLRFNIKDNKSNICRKEIARLRKCWRKAGK